MENPEDVFSGNTVGLGDGWPLWISHKKNVAKKYSRMERSGDYGEPTVITLRIKVPVKLVVLSTEQIERGNVESIIYFGRWVCNNGYDGWISTGPLQEIMICNAERHLEVVGIEKISRYEE
jgi:hypothetical protein